MNLKEQRAEWESNSLKLVCEMSDQGHSDTLLVVLKDPERQLKPYHCLRYFRINQGPTKPAVDAERWEISADAQAVDADTVLKWLADPKAIPRTQNS